MSDEARDERDRTIDALQDAVQFQRERDEARAEIERLKDEAWSTESWLLRQMKRSRDPQTRTIAENYERLFEKGVKE